jgi:hypothetical protein
MALPLTVQWNTHKESGGVPVFGLNTKQKFAPQSLDNVLDQGEFDNINPNVFRGKRTHGQLNFRQDDSTAWANNISWAGAGSPPQANYQGAKVNFSQINDSGFNTLHNLITQVSNIVVGNAAKIGTLKSQVNTYPQLEDTASAKSDTDIWNHINRYIWGKSGSQSSPQGNWSADPNAIVPNIQKNTNSIKQLEAKVQSNTDEHQYFHDTVQTLGDKMLEHSESPHNQGGSILPTATGISLPLIAVGGLAAYLLTRKK